MDTSGFDTVARHIPLYRERLLALPGWVKDQAFDIHIASGQPLSLSGKEGALQREDHLPPGRGPLPVPGAVRPQPPGGGGGRAGRAGRL